jgi:hypothetical protein
MIELYARIGRQAVTIDQQNDAYTALLEVLAGVVGGKIKSERVLVNLTDRAWNVSPEGFSQAMPATINGVPNCVIAPPERSEGPFLNDGHEVIITGRDFKVEPVG